MLLSKLVYLCVKNVVYYDDSSFTYKQFKEGKFKNDPDYSTNIYNVFLPLNEALARLSDLERIPYRVEYLVYPHNNKIDIASFEDKSGIKVKEIVGVAYQADALGIKSPVAVEFKVIGKVIEVYSHVPQVGNLLIEFKEDLPYFDDSFFDYSDDEVYQDIELNNYGISDSMCNFIMEYVAGKLGEIISPELANMHLTRAEQYFMNIRPVHSNLRQTAIYKTSRINDWE